MSTLSQCLFREYCIHNVTLVVSSIVISVVCFQQLVRGFSSPLLFLKFDLIWFEINKSQTSKPLYLACSRCSWTFLSSSWRASMYCDCCSCRAIISRFCLPCSATAADNSRWTEVSFSFSELRSYSACDNAFNNTVQHDSLQNLHSLAYDMSQISVAARHSG